MTIAIRNQGVTDRGRVAVPPQAVTLRVWAPTESRSPQACDMLGG